MTHSSPENADADVLIERLKYFSGWSAREVPGVELSPASILAWDAIDEIARLRAVISAQCAPWQPIATAPKDGTRILVCRDDRFPRNTYVVRWLKDVWNIGPIGGEWHAYPTHWMPLPSGPAPHITRMQVMTDTRTVHDPFLKKDVEVSNRLVDRLRGKYACGPVQESGEPEFGWRQFDTPPIQHEAADEIERLSAIQPQRMPPDPCPYDHDGPECLLETYAVGPCLCALTRPECGCICQNQHRRGYCTEPGCPFASHESNRGE